VRLIKFKHIAFEKGRLLSPNSIPRPPGKTARPFPSPKQTALMSVTHRHIERPRCKPLRTEWGHTDLPRVLGGGRRPTVTTVSFYTWLFAGKSCEPLQQTLPIGLAVINNKINA